MKIENKIRAVAGIFILISLLLSHFYSNYWLILNAFVGANLLQSSYTNFCPLEKILNRFDKKF
ncbi:DUF2892 domain-containing protein [Spirobacillus cienkowskii]|uniref:YgaP family membrane protein n=1 Tax=Spirobacillus cienkowskii TaxID=495820 RepID=UPI0030D1819A